MLTRRKGQLTMFMIFGLIVVMIFMFTYFILHEAAKQRIETKAQEVVESGLKKGAFQFVIEECAKDILKRGLLLIGQHSGYLPPEFAPFVVDHDLFGQNIAYLIYAEEYNLPAYPCLTKTEDRHRPDYCRYRLGEPAFFGYNMLPLIGNIEEVLGRYVADMVRGCVDFESEEWAEFLAGYSVMEGNITARVRFVGNKVTAYIDYPLIINPGEGETIVFKEWSVVIQPFSFKRFYDLLNENLEKEVTDVYFNLTDGLNDDGIGVERSDAINERGDYILRLADSRLMIDNEQYIFQFAVKNRPPVLNYIDAADAGTIIIPEAFDPDDDRIVRHSAEAKPPLTPIRIEDEYGNWDYQSVRVR